MAVKQYLRLSRRLPLHILAWVGGLWLFGVLLVLVINTFINDEANYACMGAMFGLGGRLWEDGASLFLRENLAVLLAAPGCCSVGTSPAQFVSGWRWLWARPGGASSCGTRPSTWRQ